MIIDLIIAAWSITLLLAFAMCRASAAADARTASLLSETRDTNTARPRFTDRPMRRSLVGRGETASPER